jgi:hypothetical protein
MFFTKEENPFKDLDEKRQATVVDGEDELETNVHKLKILNNGY